MIRAARDEAGLSLRYLGEEMGLSGPYLHDVEKDRRRLVVARWPALVAALPSIDLRSLAEQSVATGPVEIDASELTQRQRDALVDALMIALTTPAQRRKGAK